MSQETVCQYLEKYYTFINPKKIIGILWQYCDLIERLGTVKFSQAGRMGLVTHLAGAIERYLLKTPITATPEEMAELEHEENFAAVKKADMMLKERLNIEFAPAEVYYIVKMVDTEKVEK